MYRSCKVTVSRKDYKMDKNVFLPFGEHLQIATLQLKDGDGDPANLHKIHREEKELGPPYQKNHDYKKIQLKIIAGIVEEKYEIPDLEYLETKGGALLETTGSY